MFVLRRAKENPVLGPTPDHPWEATATFNMSPVRYGKHIYGLYRAISTPDNFGVPDQMSTIGIAESQDGLHFEERRPFITPVEEWEKFGCEDPRATFFEGRYYVFYTALSKFPFEADGIKVAVAISDDLKTIQERHLVTPFNAKAMTLFPERVNGKITLIFSAHTDSPPTKMSVVQVERIEELWSRDFWEKWHEEIDQHVINLRRNDRDHVEVGATPIKTEFGWLLIYSHIENYFGGGRPQFGIEAVLLDLNDPRKIIGRTQSAILAPKEPYELSGYVPNIVFPSGALIEKDKLLIYYGGADTTVCVARVDLLDLLSSISPLTKNRWQFKRFETNPLLLPIENHTWEAKAVFNPATIEIDGKIHILYRALSPDNTSTIGYASSLDGEHIAERLPEPVYVPTEDFERKKIENGNSGCEDPRLTQIGKKLYMCYTAFDGIGPPRVAATSIAIKDFVERQWKWEKPQLITPPGIDDKDTCILPEKINGKYLILHRIGTDICGDFLKSLDFEKNTVNKCVKVMGPRPGMWDGLKIGIAGPPLLTDDGWVLFYHGISESDHNYRVGAALLDLKDPTVVLARTTDPLFSPEEKYEKEGIVPNVVFPCGAVMRDGLFYIYYGGADKVIGGATMEVAIVTNALKRSLGK